MSNLLEGMMRSLENMKSRPPGYYKITAKRMCDRCRVKPESCQYYKEYSFLWKRKDADDQGADAQEAAAQNADVQMADVQEAAAQEAAALDAAAQDAAAEEAAALDAAAQDTDENAVGWPEDVPFTEDELEQLIMLYEDELKQSTDTTEQQ